MSSLSVSQGSNSSSAKRPAENNEVSPAKLRGRSVSFAAVVTPLASSESASSRSKSYTQFQNSGARSSSETEFLTSKAKKIASGAPSLAAIFQKLHNISRNPALFADTIAKSARTMKAQIIAHRAIGCNQFVTESKTSLELTELILKFSSKFSSDEMIELLDNLIAGEDRSATLFTQYLSALDSCNATSAEILAFVKSKKTLFDDPDPEVNLLRFNKLSRVYLRPAYLSVLRVLTGLFGVFSRETHPSLYFLANHLFDEESGRFYNEAEPIFTYLKKHKELLLVEESDFSKLLENFERTSDDACEVLGFYCSQLLDKETSYGFNPNLFSLMKELIVEAKDKRSIKEFILDFIALLDHQNSSFLYLKHDEQCSLLKTIHSDVYLEALTRPLNLSNISSYFLVNLKTREERFDYINLCQKFSAYPHFVDPDNISFFAKKFLICLEIFKRLPNHLHTAGFCLLAPLLTSSLSISSKVVEAIYALPESELVNFLSVYQNTHINLFFRITTLPLRVEPPRRIAGFSTELISTYRRKLPFHQKIGTDSTISFKAAEKATNLYDLLQFTLLTEFKVNFRDDAVMEKLKDVSFPAFLSAAISFLSRRKYDPHRLLTLDHLTNKCIQQKSTQPFLDAERSPLFMKEYLAKEKSFSQSYLSLLRNDTFNEFITRPGDPDFQSVRDTLRATYSVEISDQTEPDKLGIYEPTGGTSNLEQILSYLRSHSLPEKVNGYAVRHLKLTPVAANVNLNGNDLLSIIDLCPYINTLQIDDPFFTRPQLEKLFERKDRSLLTKLIFTGIKTRAMAKKLINNLPYKAFIKSVTELTLLGPGVVPKFIKKLFVLPTGYKIVQFHLKKLTTPLPVSYFKEAIESGTISDKCEIIQQKD